MNFTRNAKQATADHNKFGHLANLDATIEQGIARGFKRIKINNNINMPKLDIGHEAWAAKIEDSN